MKPGLLAFCLRSLYREYGVEFLVRVLLAHPLAAWKGIRDYARPKTAPLDATPQGPGCLTGIGFCLKPLHPPCPSGRANHRCACFEHPDSPPPAPCPSCLIRTLGTHALAAGHTVYIMTSARDLLHDVLLPALCRRRFRYAVLTLCRFSFEPMRLALAVCGVEARLFPFQDGDCRDYATWRRADIGDKPQQTFLDEATLATLLAEVTHCPEEEHRQSVRSFGNLYEPSPPDAVHFFS